MVTGDLATFDTRSNLITMKGNVVLTQCKNVLRGDRLFVNMTTGVSRVESDSGRVQGLFIQSEGGGCGAKSSTPAAPSPAAKPPIPLLGREDHRYDDRMLDRSFGALPIRYGFIHAGRLPYQRSESHRRDPAATRKGQVTRHGGSPRYVPAEVAAA